MNERTLDRIALAAACLCLVVIGLRPATTRMVDPAIVVVRTPGATMAEARRVADSLHAGAVVESSEQDAFNTTGAELHLVGWGLDERELRRAHGQRFVLHPRPLPDGIREVSWPGSLTLGDPMTVHVTVRGRAGRFLVLADDTGPLDSVPLPAGEPATLQLRHTPPAAGVARYSLRFGARADTFTIFVAPAEPPATMILASAPSREWSDLRDWLAGQGAVVTLRTTVSRDRIATDRINNDAPADRLTPALLARTGLVVTDGRTLASLPVTERAALRGAISEGLGLLLVHDRSARDGRGLSTAERRFFLPWRTTAVGDIDTRDVRPRHDGVRASETPVAAEAFVFAAEQFTTPILDDGQGGVLASTIRQGRGAVTATVVNGAGRWLRGGESRGYADYWSALIRPTARADATTERWDAGRRPLIVGQEVGLVRWGQVTGDAAIGGTRVALVDDPLIQSRSVAKWWPMAEGMVPIGQHAIWVSDTSAWPTWRAAERRRVTAAAIGAEQGIAGVGTRVPRRTAWPLWPFFLGMVIATGWLWRQIRN